MTKLHRDIAVRLIQCTEDEEFTDQATIKVPNTTTTCKLVPVCPGVFIYGFTGYPLASSPGHSQLFNIQERNGRVLYVTVDGST